MYIFFCFYFSLSRQIQLLVPSYTPARSPSPAHQKKNHPSREKFFQLSHIHTNTFSLATTPCHLFPCRLLSSFFFRDFLMFVLLLMICRRESVAEESRNRARSRHNLTYFNNFLLLLGKSVFCLANLQNYFLLGRLLFAFAAARQWTRASAGRSERSSSFILPSPK